ncbi:phospholipid-binding protein, PBP family [Mycolicibacterium chubuense NBB4]|uniref:Phospholipid-binding protein, PBP family n=1 Tax=Mycolicibacterium chubuense (strain NBB4) TaxID=710421 RepID=I4BK89_MYCCN|nr:YbhB/YbcL family Raf kinase inhibitor-like protein [Mycolicibacterium chubuense]AFM17696.1 phospholipid-binding protein, PBP family [Mycolicibacterium chubuense NBB4]
MLGTLSVLAVVAAGLATAAAVSAAPAQFELTSPAFADNSQIPAEFSCHGRNVPPPLQWQNAPQGTQSLALVVDDPDAVGGLYIHWVVSGIPPSATGMVDGVLPEGAHVSANSGGSATYLGPCPPAGTGVHHYRFQLFALKNSLTLTPATPARTAVQTITGAALAVASTVGLFGA